MSTNVRTVEQTLPRLSLARNTPAPRTDAHRREHQSVLAGIEKRCLVWIARRLPPRINSDHLTALGAAAMLGTGAAFAAARADERALLLVPLMLAINWFGDSLDGTVARVRNAQRPRYGFYIDHVVDVGNATVLFTGLAFSTIASPWTAGALLVAYLLLAAESFLATHALGVFRISFAGFGPTELRILLSAGAVAAFFRPVVAPFGLAPVYLFDLGGWIGAAGMLAAFAFNAVRNGRELYRAEPAGPGVVAPHAVPDVPAIY
jgi:phosphatidylglycerophosphate synthase